ncbi:protein tyrosine phosphatase [Mesorhizobium sp. Root552]|uniref:low molecular weight protein-tyrosine-phosphatase n=1 Tax=Mesorhizobium sp. Root552 TaxID=1736555 RepID=UPI0006F58D67|nr:low molecular weight protein-tyrosine-phosphatase [Mesorhizobium sp. Root552]KQZ29537.1 protein tyrosine phosphatase [Mesorhizobium sp. Root552]
MDAKPKKSILFVCLGNICRSPLAEGVFAAVLEEKRLSEHFELDSAGTGGWHAGSAPDPRSVAIAASHGIDISGQKARKVNADDFSRFDLILAMDRSNVEELQRLAPAAARERIHLFLEFADGNVRDVPDPYYGGPDGFAAVYRMIRDASDVLSSRLAERMSVSRSGHASSTM